MISLIPRKQLLLHTQRRVVATCNSLLWRAQLEKCQRRTVERTGTRHVVMISVGPDPYLREPGVRRILPVRDG